MSALSLCPSYSIILDDTRKRKGVKLRSAGQTEQVRDASTSKEKPWMHQPSRAWLSRRSAETVAVCKNLLVLPAPPVDEHVEAGDGSPARLLHRYRRCPVGKFLPIRVGLSASGKANGQHHPVRARSIKGQAIIMLERRARRNDIRVDPASIELPVAGLDAQHNKADRILGVIDRFVGEKRLLTYGERSLVTGHHEARDTMGANDMPGRRRSSRRHRSRWHCGRRHRSRWHYSRRHRGRLLRHSRRRRRKSRRWQLRCVGWRFQRWQFGGAGEWHRCVCRKGCIRGNWSQGRWNRVGGRRYGRECGPQGFYGKGCSSRGPGQKTGYATS